MYKILNGLSPDIIQEIFETKRNYYKVTHTPAFSSRNTKAVRYGLQAISYMASKNVTLYPKKLNKLLASYFYLLARQIEADKSKQTNPRREIQIDNTKTITKEQIANSKVASYKLLKKNR